MNNSGLILLVDDEESFLLSTAALLCGDGYACDCAGDGVEAVELLRNRRYDVLVADIRMPGNAQLELVRSAKELAPGMPVILVTGYPSLETAMRSVSLPVTAYLTKPVDYAELRAHVDQALQHSATRRTLASVAEQIRHCLTQLEETIAGTSETKDEVGPVSIVLMRSLASGLSELLRLRAEAMPRETRPKLCEVLDCPSYVSHRDAIVEAIEVLRRTKNSFKSKELGELRLRLEGFL